MTGMGEMISDPVDVPGLDANPVVVWATIGAVLVALIARTLSSAAPNVTEALTRWKSYRASSEDARIADLSEQVDYLLGRVHVHDQRIQRQDRYLYDHAQWDRQVLQAAIEAGLDVGAFGSPPPLWPPVD